MIVGETVYVEFQRLTGTDEFGNEVWETGGLPSASAPTWGDLLTGLWGGGASGLPKPDIQDGLVEVGNVLVNPSTTTYDRIEPDRPMGFECDLTLYFPREFDMDMRGAFVIVRGERYRVVGDPQRYTDANLPPDCKWNLVVRVVRFDV